MTRPNFDVKIAGECFRTDIHGNNPVHSICTAHEAVNTQVGVTRRKPVGWIPPTNYTFTYRSINPASGSCVFGSHSDGSLGTRYSGIVGAFDGSVSRFNSLNHFNAAVSETTAQSDPSGFLAQSQIKARNSFRGASVNLGVAWGTRNKIARQVGDTATRIARAVYSLRRGHVRDAMDDLGISYNPRVRGSKIPPRGSNWINNWLELQYGWKPLLSDIYGASQILARSVDGDWRVTTRGTVSGTQSYSNTIPFGGTSGVDASTCTATVTRSAFVRIDALPDNTAKMVLGAVGIANPLNVAWQLVPYSFVVDWFLPVSDWLQSLDAMFGYKNAQMSSSFLVRASWNDTGYSGTSGSWYVDNLFTGTKKLVYLSRTAGAVPTIPPFPGFRDPRSFGHMANGLALLAQAFIK